MQVRRLLLAQIAYAAFAAPPRSPQFVVTGPHRDPGEPRDERLLAAALIIIQGEISFNEALLDDLLDLIAAREEAVTESRNQTSMALEQAAEGRLIASARGRDQFVVRHLRVRLDAHFSVRPGGRFDLFHPRLRFRRGRGAVCLRSLGDSLFHPIIRVIRVIRAIRSSGLSGHPGHPVIRAIRASWAVQAFVIQTPRSLSGRRQIQMRKKDYTGYRNFSLEIPSGLIF